MTSADAKLQALERELLDLRAAAADVRRERAALAAERAAMDVDHVRRLRELDGARAQLELELAAVRREAAVFAAERDVWQRQQAELVDARERLARALRWSPRHHLGVLAHRVPAIRRLRARVASERRSSP